MMLLAIGAVACARGPAPPASPSGQHRGEPSNPVARPVPRQMLATAPDGETIVMELAETEEERARGLMGRVEVPRGTGMYFEFGEAGDHPFWMLHCLVPLDIVWLDASGTVVHVGENLPPCPAEPCPTYTSEAPAARVIEVAAGEARRMGIVRGARVLITELPAARKAS